MNLITPKYYQREVINEMYSHWLQNKINLAAIMPTGSGKTYTMGFIAKEFNQRKKYAVALAHRNVLLSQLSLSFAKLGIYHNLLCSRSADKYIRDLHVKKLGRCYVSENSHTLVTSVPTIVRRNVTSWASSIGLWLMDETHHLLRKNQWGRAIQPFDNALGAGFTATFCRLDKKGLGRDADGVFDGIVKGPTLASLIENKDLCSYRIVTTPMSELTHDDVGKLEIVNGEYEKAGTKKIVGSNKVVGDVVHTYKKFAMGLRGLTFAYDIEECERYAKAFNDAGVPAIALSSKNTESERWEGLERFERNEILQLVSCQLFEEGFDVPLCYTASIASPTKSFVRYSQRLGRILRTHPEKNHAILFDHVGDVEEHGLPDYVDDWEMGLDKGYRPRPKEDKLKMHRCTNPQCWSEYILPAKECPWCGTPYDSGRTTASRKVEQVDGELRYLTPEEIQKLHYKKNKMTKPINEYAQDLKNAHVYGGKYHGLINAHKKQQEAQAHLQHAMRGWCKVAQMHGLDIPQAHAQFEQLFGINHLEAQTLKTAEARKLTERIKKHG